MAAAIIMAVEARFDRQAQSAPSESSLNTTYLVCSDEVTYVLSDRGALLVAIARRLAVSTGVSVD